MLDSQRWRRSYLCLVLGHVAQSLDAVLGVVEPGKGLTLEDIIDKEDQALAVVRWMFMYMSPFQMRSMQGRSREMYPSASGQD